MRLKWRMCSRLLAALLLLLPVIAFPLKTAAQQFAPELNVDVSLGVDDTVLKITGKTSPQALVTILSDGAVIGTVTANSDGTFEKSFPSQTPGLRNVKLFAETPGGQTTDTVAENINLASHAETTLNVFLPTTLSLSASQVEQGGTITFSGATYPGASVTVVLDNNLTQTVTAGSDGRWSLEVQTDGFYIGTHSAYAVAQDQNGDQSAPTSKRVFQVTEADDEGAGQEPAPTAPEQIETPVITSPQSGQHTTQTPIEVCGLASPNAQVEIWEGGEIIGSVFANHEGEWCLTVDLSEPRHEITARACIADVCSEFSKPVVIFFDGHEGVAGLRLTLEKYRFTGVAAGDPITLEIILEGGEPPYEASIDWGNADAETITLERSRTPVRLTYESAGLYTGIVTARDNSGQMQTRYFSVMVVESPGWTVAPIIAAIIAAIVGAILYAAWQKFAKKLLARRRAKSNQ